MSSRRRVLPLLALALVVVAAPGCPAFTRTGKFLGVIATPEFVLPDAMPEDFRLTVDVRDQADPPIDYLLAFERSGQVEYRVVARAPRRVERTGSFQVHEDQVISLWNAVTAARFDQLPERYPEDGDGADRAAGVQTYWVQADGMDRRVEVVFTRIGALDAIRKTALDATPEEIRNAQSEGTGPRDAPKQYVADTTTKRFHVPDCPALKDVPAERRQPYGSKYDALDFGNAPCPECRPTETRER